MFVSSQSLRHSATSPVGHLVGIIASTVDSSEYCFISEHSFVWGNIPGKAIGTLWTVITFLLVTFYCSNLRADIINPKYQPAIDNDDASADPNVPQIYAEIHWDPDYKQAWARKLGDHPTKDKVKL